MFSQVCVKNSVHRGVVCPIACWDTPLPQADTFPGRHPLGRHPLGQTPPMGRHPQADTPQMATATYGTHPTGMHSCHFF